MRLNTSKTVVFICFGLFLLTVISRVPVLRTVGETWDEQTAAVQIGERYLGNLQRLDFNKDSWDLGAEHPPLARYLYGAATIIPKKIPAIRNWDSEYHQNKEYTVPRVLSAIFGGLTVVLVFLIGKFLFNYRVGAVSAVILMVFPPFIAYTSTSSLESVFILTTTIFVWSLLHALKSNSTKWHFVAIVTLTLCFLTRYNGLFFVIFYAGVIVAKYHHEIFKLKARQIPWPVLASSLIFLSLTYILWPWLWANPLRLFESFARTPAFVSNEYFLGKLGPMPWYYYFIYFLVTTPEVLTLLFLGFVLTVLISFAKFKSLFVNRYSLIILFWFLTPFLASFVSFKQDGIRYVIAFLPPLALISGLMVTQLVDKLPKPSLRIFFVFFMMLGIVYPTVLFYPYYLDYYNLASGGPRAAYENDRFDVGWWGEGSLNAVRFINKNAEVGATVKVSFIPFHVLPKFREDLVLFKVEDSQTADYILINCFSRNFKPATNLSNYKEILAVSTPLIKTFSAPLTQVYQQKLNKN